MRLLQRTRKDLATEAQEEPAPTHPFAGRYETRTADRRTDLTCLLCGRTVAFGVREESLAQDICFFHEQHAPFCMRA